MVLPRWRHTYVFRRLDWEQMPCIGPCLRQFNKAFLPSGVPCSGQLSDSFASRLASEPGYVLVRTSSIIISRCLPPHRIHLLCAPTCACQPSPYSYRKSKILLPPFPPRFSSFPPPHGLLFIINDANFARDRVKIVQLCVEIFVFVVIYYRTFSIYDPMFPYTAYKRMLYEIPIKYSLDRSWIINGRKKVHLAITVSFNYSTFSRFMQRFRVKKKKKCFTS